MTTFTPTESGSAAPRRTSVLRSMRAVGRRSVAAHMASTTALLAADCAAFTISLLVAVTSSQIAADWYWPLSESIDGRQFQITATIELALLAAVMLYLAGKGQYSRRIPFWTELQAVTVASTAALVCNGFVQYSLQRHDSRLLLVLTWALLPFFVIMLRTIARKLLATARLWQIRVVVVGDPAPAQRACTALLSEPGLGYEIGAVLAPPHQGSEPGANLWRDVLRRNGCEMLVLAHDGASDVAESLVRGRVPFAIVPPHAALPVHGFERTSLLSHDTVLFTFSHNLAEPVARAFKVAFDVAAAFVLLLLLLPVLIVITMAISLDGGAVLYAHQRVGVGGRLFPCFKFRSMVRDSDVVLRQLLENDPAAATEWAATQKLRNDPRVTWIGRLLRKTSLDELPQLLNVLRLEMSLVGPRPIVLAEVQRYGDDIAYYYETRPGLTGLWQVSGRSDTGYAQRVRLDTWYVKNWSIWRDVAILFKTVPAVLKRRGAV